MRQIQSKTERIAVDDIRMRTGDDGMDAPARRPKNSAKARNAKASKSKPSKNARNIS